MSEIPADDPRHPDHIALLRAEAAHRREVAETHPQARNDPEWKAGVLEAASLLDLLADGYEKPAGKPDPPAGS